MSAVSFTTLTVLFVCAHIYHKVYQFSIYRLQNKKQQRSASTMTVNQSSKTSAIYESVCLLRKEKILYQSGTELPEMLQCSCSGALRRTVTSCGLLRGLWNQSSRRGNTIWTQLFWADKQLPPHFLIFNSLSHFPSLPLNPFSPFSLIVVFMLLFYLPMVHFSSLSFFLSLIGSLYVFLCSHAWTRQCHH